MSTTSVKKSTGMNMNTVMEVGDEDHIPRPKRISVDKVIDLLQSKNVYRCTYPKCKAYFDRPYRLAQHILAHNNIRPYICNHPSCGKAYTSKSHLDRHLRTVHMPQEKDVVYSCPRCLKTFANRQNLKRHMNTVHKMEITCEICFMQFKKKNQLSTHMYQHTGIKAFSCEVCPESFVSLYLKKRHMRLHKTYTCSECSTEFNHWPKFQTHLKTEHQKDEFVCNECGRSFKQRCHIVRHVKIHLHSNKTFLCPYENCGRTYSRNSNLKQHILIKHLNMLHECMICHSQLSTKAKLNYHLQLHYNANKDGGSTPKVNNTERKKRKDEGSFKSSTALKLAGLTKVPEELEPSYDEVQNEFITLSDLTKETEESQQVSESQQQSESPPVNMSVKTEYIEVEVDIPYDI